MVYLYGLAAANVLHMWSRKVDRGAGGGVFPSACDVADVLKIHHSKVQHGTNCYTEPRCRSDYLERPKQGTTDAKFGSWIFRSFC
jgi:hypothetical protein